MPADTVSLEPVRERLKSFDGFLERLSKEYNMSTLELVRHLPGESAKVITSDRMIDILHDVSEWGAILFITEGNHVITGQSAELPQVFHKDGYYHFFGVGGFGGHIKDDACAHIAFIERQFQNRNSRSIHFYDGDGEPMFKIFLSRELNGEMKEDQVNRWKQLRRAM
ncbi:MAG: heme utilization cystosolic carrier protein HutX [Pseudomonadota bacterium]